MDSMPGLKGLIIDIRGNAQVIRAQVPLATMFGYVNSLRSMTQGRANYTMEPHHYDQVPADIAGKIVSF